MTYAFAPEPQKSLPIVGGETCFPVRRIFCVGRNYVAHAAEMGGEVDREAPWYFTKSPHSLAQSGVTVPYPQGTQNYHHEVEFVVALGPDATVFGYACGLDMTRRDLQQIGKDNRRPWDLGKDVEDSAVIGDITLAAAFGAVYDQSISLQVNEAIRQNGLLSDMVWSVPDLIAHLSVFYILGAGDVIMTGTPSGVGPVVPGDVITASVAGLSPVRLTIAPHTV
ncbi:MAG: fumarylpyruvate hydrolase [Yoonia sp.]|jgi:fumarylpyruvate hydrolase